MLSSRLANLSGLSLLAGVIQLPMSSLNIMNCIIRIRRFTLRDARLLSLLSLAISLSPQSLQGVGEAYPRYEEQVDKRLG
jgi:hypothetical protein